MKKILLLSLLFTLSLTNLYSAEKKIINADNLNFVYRLGIDTAGSRDNATAITGGKYGLDKNIGFEMTFGAEDKTKDFDFGVRRTLNLYSHGDGTFYNDTAIPYSAKTRNFGGETTISVFYKATKYFQPYMGLGLGINFSSYDDEGQSITASTYRPTLHGVLGFNSQLIGPIGFYVQYKYTIADSYKNQVPVDNSGTIVLVEIEDKGVSGSKTMAGLNLVF